MHSSRVRKIVLTLICVCGIAVLLAAYLTVKPQRDSAHLINVLEQVQVGHTRIKDVAPALLKAVAVAGVKGGRCEADLTGRSIHKGSLSPDSSVVSPLPRDSDRVCGYGLTLSNDFLHGMRLAPITSISVDIDANEGIVDQILLFYLVGDFGNIGLVQIIQAVPGKGTSCGQDTCVQRSYGSDGAVVDIRIQVAADAPSTERRRLISINTHCLSKIGGCKNAGELLPISE